MWVRVAFQSIVPKGAETLELKEGEMFVQGLPAANRTLPDYPMRWLDQGVSSVVVCADLFIDEGGRVYEVQPLVQGEDCPALAVEYRADFNQAVAEAVRQWDFIPSYLCETVAGVAPDAECRGEGGKRPIAIRLGTVSCSARPRRELRSAKVRVQDARQVCLALRENKNAARGRRFGTDRFDQPASLRFTSTDTRPMSA